MDGRIYLDHHATTPVDPGGAGGDAAVLHGALRQPVQRQPRLRPGGAAARSRRRGSRWRRWSARRPEDIVFTSGATESDNLAVRGAARALAAKGRHVVTTTIEHAAVLEPCRTLEREGFEVTRVAVGPPGIVAAADVGGRAAAGHRPRLGHGREQRGGHDPAGGRDRARSAASAASLFHTRRRAGRRPDPGRRGATGAWTS